MLRATRTTRIPLIIMSRVGACLIFVALAEAVSLSGCMALPTDVVRTPSTALGDTDSTRLGLAIADRVMANPGKSGIYPLKDGREAFAARVIVVSNNSERRFAIRN